MSVVVPAYNEERGIATSVARVRDGSWSGIDLEIIVVDNASEDATVSVLAPLRGRFPGPLLQNDFNRGKGYSMRRGHAGRAGDAAAALRRGLRTPRCASLGDARALIDDADVVVGSRLAPGAQVDRRQPLRAPDRRAQLRATCAG